MGLVRLLLGVAGCGTGDDKPAASVKQGRESGPLSFLALLAFENLGLSLVQCPGQSTTLSNRSCNALGTCLTNEKTPRLTNSRRRKLFYPHVSNMLLTR